MSRIPEKVAESSFSRKLIKLGYILLYRGKVGELYEIPGKPDQLLMMRSDRLSIFDFVLPCLVQGKGEVLIALTHFWLTQVFQDIPNHLLAWGWNVGRWKAAGWNMKDVAELPLERILLVKRCKIWKYEMIFRAHIGGSVWKDYLKDGTACGNILPSGLSKWQKLPRPIFTPTTKAEEGHDLPVTIQRYAELTGFEGGRLASMDLAIYQRAYEYAAKRGILILDTKFENTFDGKVADEVLTPDSSRFTTYEGLAAAIQEGRDPIFYDKEPVRIWGREVGTPWGVGLQNLDTENEEHLAYVAESLQVPNEVIYDTKDRYDIIVAMITGKVLRKYQAEDMKIPSRS
ncbi:MAG: phosphoribosylaminoimidazolesuccinocarboxamide synthase [bacterium]|nr:phosphoribosylaminoimidazolesuccinocarboxamide synthase [bacterium]